MRIGETSELRQDLERSVHRFRCERAAAETSGTETHHLLFAIDHFEREVGAHAHHDHVERIGSDIDGRDAHRDSPLRLQSG